MICSCLKKFLLPCFILLIALLSVYFLKYNQANASENVSVDATVKLSVCGNGAAESGEACDTLDLSGKTCLEQGFTGGTIACDIGCDLNTSGCYPQPTSANIPTLTPLKVSSAPVLPEMLKLFYAPYLDQNGRIKTDELFAAVRGWVDEWRSVLGEQTTSPETISFKGRRCDINNDGACNLQDLSVMLFYTSQ